MNKFTAYLKDSYKELVHKVTWPNWDQLQQSTMIVLGATLIITGMVGYGFCSQQLHEIYLPVI